MSSGGPGSPGYSPGGNPVYTPSYPTPILGSGCGQSDLCDCLGDTIAGISSALYTIDKTLNDKLGSVCDHIDECIDKIIEAIDKKYKGIHNDCDTCRSMVQQGLAGTLEFALTCASCDLEECNTVCSLGDTDSEGKCCQGCGQEKCCCVEGECKPCDETETKKKYVGWCNRDTGAVVVQKEGEPSPGPGFVSVAISEDEQSALADTEAYCSSYKKQPEQPTIPPPSGPVGSVTPLCDLFGLANGSSIGAISGSQIGSQAVAAWGNLTARIRALGIEGFNLGSLDDIFRSVTKLAFGWQDQVAEGYIPIIAPLFGCNNSAFVESAKVLTAVALAQKNTAVDFSEFTLPYRYAMHAACRNVQLTPDQAMSAYLANGLSLEGLDAHWTIAGYCPEALPPIIQAQKAKAIPLQLAVARRRELIEPAEYHKGMRQLGYLDERGSELIFDLTEQVPPLTDILRFMVRDADDEGLVNQLHMDDYFDEKYRDQLKKWSTDQGIPEKVARYAWRAHWSIPAPGQLFEFWHRLRKNPEFGGQDKLWEDIKAALIQQDILPYWHKHFEAVSFRPLGRVDIRRAFNIGALSEDDLGPAYTQLGYSDETVEKLTKFSKRLRDESAIGHKAVKLWLKFAIDRTEATQRMTDGGLPAGVVNQALDDASIGFQSSPYAAAFVRGDLSRDTFVQRLENQGVGVGMTQRITDLLAVKRSNHPAVAEYIAGVIDRGTAWSDMTTDGMDGDVSERLLADADKSFRQARVVNCQNAIKSRYLTGELDQQEAIDELTTSGTTGERASSLLDWWGCERAKSGKVATAAMLCQWLARGAIQSADFTRRLENIGYSEGDAALMLEDCLISINAKRLAEAKKEAKENAQLQQRTQRALAKAAALEQRQAAQIFRAQQAAAAARKNREKQLLSAASKIAGKCDCDIYDSRTLARELRDSIMNDYGLNQDEALQALILGVEEWSGGAKETLGPIVGGFAQDAAAVTGEPAV